MAVKGSRPRRAAVPTTDLMPAKCRRNAGEQFGTPVGPEAPGHLAVRRGGPQLAFGTVVVGRHFRVVKKGEEVTADRRVALPQPSAVAIGRLQRQDCIEIPLQATAVVTPGALLQVAAPPGQDDGAQQQALHPRCKEDIAGFDGMAEIAELVGQANLPRVGMAALGGREVRHPDLRPVAVQQLAHHGATGG